MPKYRKRYHDQVGFISEKEITSINNLEKKTCHQAF